jgi:hypothetical protein
VLLEMSSFSDFLVEQVTRFRDDWETRRAELVAEGVLPAQRPGGKPR